ncbi:MAG: efflux RND transporter periplasmic adaptor subunit [Proteobacteria bacterium]|nr:efflux RND transporter periplasmic adaptor subunit [Pseudomonadota bacterium]
MFKSKKNWIIFSLVVLVIISAGGYWYYKSKRQNKTVYKEYAAEKGDLEVSIQATGQVSPENRLIVKPSISGRIETVLVDEGSSVKAGQILGWLSSNDRAALLDMAKAKGEEEVKHWESIYKPSPIIAPLSGIIISKNIERGQVVGTGDTAFVISDRLIINAQVDETDLARVKLQQNVSIKLDAYSDRPIDGTVVRIAYEARNANNVTVYDIRVLPKEVPAFMRAGMTASVRFIEMTRIQVVKIPVMLLKSSKSVKELRKPGSQVKVLVKTGETKGEPEVAEKDIVLGATDGRMVEVTTGLEGTETLLEDVTPDEGKSSNPFSPFGNTKKSSSSSNRQKK